MKLLIENYTSKNRDGEGQIYVGSLIPILLLLYPYYLKNAFKLPRTHVSIIPELFDLDNSSRDDGKGVTCLVRGKDKQDCIMVKDPNACGFTGADNLFLLPKECLFSHFVDLVRNDQIDLSENFAEFHQATETFFPHEKLVMLIRARDLELIRKEQEEVERKKEESKKKRKLRKEAKDQKDKEVEEERERLMKKARTNSGNRDLAPNAQVVALSGESGDDDDDDEDEDVALGDSSATRTAKKANSADGAEEEDDAVEVMDQNDSSMMNTSIAPLKSPLKSPSKLAVPIIVELNVNGEEVPPGESKFRSLVRTAFTKQGCSDLFAECDRRGFVKSVVLNSKKDGSSVDDISFDSFNGFVFDKDGPIDHCTKIAIDEWNTSLQSGSVKFDIERHAKRTLLKDYIRLKNSKGSADKITHLEFSELIPRVSKSSCFSMQSYLFMWQAWAEDINKFRSVDDFVDADDLHKQTKVAVFNQKAREKKESETSALSKAKQLLKNDASMSGSVILTDAVEKDRFDGIIALRKLHMLGQITQDTLESSERKIHKECDLRVDGFHNFEDEEEFKLHTKQQQRVFDALLANAMVSFCFFSFNVFVFVSLLPCFCFQERLEAEKKKRSASATTVPTSQTTKKTQSQQGQEEDPSNPESPQEQQQNASVSSPMVAEGNSHLPSETATTAPAQDTLMDDAEDTEKEEAKLHDDTADSASGEDSKKGNTSEDEREVHDDEHSEDDDNESKRSPAAESKKGTSSEEEQEVQDEEQLEDDNHATSESSSSEDEDYDGERKESSKNKRVPKNVNAEPKTEVDDRFRHLEEEQQMIVLDAQNTFSHPVDPSAVRLDYDQEDIIEALDMLHENNMLNDASHEWLMQRMKNELTEWRRLFGIIIDGDPLEGNLTPEDITTIERRMTYYEYVGVRGKLLKGSYQQFKAFLRGTYLIENVDLSMKQDNE